MQEINCNLHPETTSINKWSIIKNAVKSHVGCRKKENFKHMSDSEIEIMSKLQKDLSLQIENVRTMIR